MTRKLTDYPSLTLLQESLDGMIDINRIFGRIAPFHLEVGSGKGTFLVHEAKAHPENNYLGIEWANKFYRHAVDRIGRWNLTNVRLLRTDAETFLRDHVPDASVDGVHVYFPDPWPKKRHHKRRFFDVANLEQIIRVLKDNGLLRLATDHAGYFEQITQVLAGFETHFDEVSFLPTAGAEAGEWVGTNFERKYLKEERAVYKMALCKRHL